MNFKKSQLFIDFPYIRLGNLKIVSTENKICFGSTRLVAQFAASSTLLPRADASIAPPRYVSGSVSLIHFLFGIFRPQAILHFFFFKF